MSSLKYERRLLIMTYLLCIGMFTNLAVLKDPIDKGALIMGAVLILLTGTAHYVIRKFFPEGDKFLLIFSCVLAIIGIAVIYRLKPELAIKQLIWFVVGITLYTLIVVLLPNLKSFEKYKYYYLAGVMLFMPMALLPSIGEEINGSRNWVKIAGFTFQPSEIGKIFLVLYLSAALCKYVDKKNIKEDFKQLIEPAAVVMGALGCMVLQKDLGSALIFFGISVTMLYIATSKLKYILTCLGLFAFGAITSYSLFGHVRKRVLIWRDVWKYANDESYQIVQGLYGMSSGGFVGPGLGQGYPGFIPENQTDFIFASMTEELGLVFGIGVMLLYFLLFYRGMRAALSTSNNFSKLNAVGFSAMIAMQVLVIIGGVFAVIPLTGITLPLISYGGTSMMTMFFALGILQKISEEG